MNKGEEYDFILEIDKDGLELGSVIYTPTKQEAIIQEIFRVQFIDYSTVRIIGTAKVIN